MPVNDRLDSLDSLDIAIKSHKCLIMHEYFKIDIKHWRRKLLISITVASV